MSTEITFCGSTEKVIVPLRLTILYRDISLVACKHVNDHNNSMSMRERKKNFEYFFSEKKMASTALFHKSHMAFMQITTLTAK